MDNEVPLDFGGIILEENNESVCIVNKLNCGYFVTDSSNTFISNGNATKFTDHVLTVE